MPNNYLICANRNRVERLIQLLGLPAANWTALAEHDGFPNDLPVDRILCDDDVDRCSAWWDSQVVMRMADGCMVETLSERRYARIAEDSKPKRRSRHAPVFGIPEKLWRKL